MVILTLFCVVSDPLLHYLVNGILLVDKLHTFLEKVRHSSVGLTLEGYLNFVFGVVSMYLMFFEFFSTTCSNQ